MADYWKSQPRKFCQYCKCWIADNKPSIEFHERGKNHKENVTAKISEIKKKSVAKAKQEERMSKDFAAMEEAALKAYQDDLKRMEREAAGLDSPVQTTTKIQPQPKPQVKIQVKPHGKKHHKIQKANKKPRDQSKAQVWVEGQTDGGNKYYYNTVTGESQWEKPDGFQGVPGSASEQPGQTQSSSGCPWLEAVSPDGYTYYYNPDTAETSWEKPANFPSNEASGPDHEGKSQEEASTPQLPSGTEESSNSAPASQEAEVPEETNQQHTVPKISFRKRKIEADSPEKEGKDVVGENAPKEEAVEMKKEEEVQNKTAESEKKEEEVTRRVTQAKRPKAANPYGAWERIKEVVDPYTKVDLQLPKFEGVSTSAPADLPPEPKPKFKERVITSLGEEGGPTSFRKSKTQNSKSRSLRQRDNDD